MKNKVYIIQTLLIAIAIFAIAGCAKDNYVAPKSILSGHVVYNGQAVGVRTNGFASGGAQLELWQHGYAFFTKIPVFVNQDGSYSALLFDGDYLLDRLSGAPWVNQTDSITVHVKGNTIVDVPVTPFHFVSAATYTNTATTVTATITITKPNAASVLTSAGLYLGRTTLVDNKLNDGAVSVAASAITIGTPFTATITIPAALQTASVIYARVGVTTVGSTELEFSQVVAITLH
jgi:hypothetical protein